MNSRINRVQHALQAQHLNAFVVTDAFNLQYLANFPGLAGDGCLVVTPHTAVLVTDARYEVEMPSRLPDGVTLEITRQMWQVVAQYLPATGQRVGFEDRINWQNYTHLQAVTTATLVSQHDLVEKLRAVKDATEIMALKQSAQLASQAYVALLDYVQVGMTEKDVSLFLYNWMVQHGASAPSFSTIVASGYRSAMPHGDATDKKLASHELVTVDFGFYYHGYTSDMTRTFALGKPDDRLKAAYAIVLAAQQKMITAMYDGVNGFDVDAAARDYISECGYGKFFNHGSGHSIGLDIHEDPVTNPNCQEQLWNGYVMTVEPGIYLPDLGGIRIEDDVLITAEGPQVLTTAPKNLIIL